MQQTQSRHVDIAIAGGGPVGLALAGMLLARGVSASRIAVIDAKPLSEVVTDPRAIALSAGSRQLLEAINAWPQAASAITQIHVSRRGSFGRTLIDAEDYRLPALGYVCRYGDVLQSLATSLAASQIMQYRPLGISGMTEGDDSVQISLSNETGLSASILVQAEGGIFGEQKPKHLHRDYQQCALISTVWSASPPPGRAFERFTDQGPLALLPMQDGYALVWCMRPENAERLIALDDETFLQALQQAFGQRAGRFQKIDKRFSYPLGLNAQPQDSAKTVSIGNASQTLHPVAGQGLNLGLRDAAVLASLLAREVSPSQLNRFDSQRRTDRNTTIRLTDLMARVFASSADQSFTQDALGLSLAAIDLMPTLRQQLAEQMMYGQR